MQLSLLEVIKIVTFPTSLMTVEKLCHNGPVAAVILCFSTMDRDDEQQWRKVRSWSWLMYCGIFTRCNGFFAVDSEMNKPKSSEGSNGALSKPLYHKPH